MDSTFLRINNGLKLQIPDADIPERQRKATEVMFADVISMGDASQTEDFAVDVMDEAVGKVQTSDTRKESSTEVYEKYQYKDKTIRTEEKAISEQDVEKVKEEITEFTESVTEVIQEELHVSKEEIEAAMEELGLTFMDLLDAGNLANLVAKLNGESNPNNLLCSETFTNILQEVNVLGNELLKDVQMTLEELEFVFDELAKMEALAENETVESSVEVETVAKEAVETAADDVVTVKQPETVDDTAEVDVESAKKAEVTVKEVVAEKEFQEQMGNSEENADETLDAKAETKQTIPVTEPKAEHAIAFDTMTAGTVEGQFAEVESTQALPNYVNVSELMEQFAEHTRVLVSDEVTKMEMQLNPEHLGKLFVEITEHEGSITAKIQTQNAIVREALEMQLADLRQNLIQAGVKVDAVEVTVASHGFERNLEQDANSQKQQEDAQPKTATRRNINMNELDSLSGLMTEEEAIVAKMMAEQGNRVNFTA